MLVELHRIAAAKFLPADGSWPNHFRNAVLGAISLAQWSMAASVFLTSRGHSRSINIRVPSAATLRSYARFSLMLAAMTFLLINAPRVSHQDEDRLILEFSTKHR